jgi:hypothetical protein
METKRIEATIAWLSPANWRYRQYRCAALSFVCPAGAIPRLGAASGHPAAVTTRGAATVQHQLWEKATAQTFARAIHVLTIENAELKKTKRAVTPLRSVQ